MILTGDAAHSGKVQPGCIAMPRLYGLLIARDEADIVGQSLVHALAHCEKIVCMDNISTDGTWEIMQDMAARHKAMDATLDSIRGRVGTFGGAVAPDAGGGNGGGAKVEQWKRVDGKLVKQ